MSKKSLKVNKKNLSHELGTKGVFIIGIMFVFVLLGVIVSNLQTKGYKSKAAEVTLDCKKTCDEKIPKHMSYTEDCAAKIAAGSTEPCGCEKACLKVIKAINGGMTCEQACTSQLRVMRGQICQKILCPLIKGDAPETVPADEGVEVPQTP